MARKKNIFNQSMLDRLSSTEQLDKMVVITPLPVWLFIAGGILVVIIVLGWSLTAWMSVTTPASGVYLPQGQTYSLASEQAGIVKEVYVDKGQNVDKGDKLFAFDSAAAKKELEDLQNRRADVESITTGSSGDKVTEDTGELINIKIQMGATGVEGSKARISVDAYQKQLSKLKSSVSSAQSKVNKAKADYEAAYEKYKAEQITAEELASYQSAYQNAQTEYSSVKSQYDSMSQQVEAAKAQKKATDVGDKSQKDSLAKQFNATKEGILNSLDEQIKATGEIIKDGTVRSTVDGEITEVKVSQGMAIAQGSEYIAIREETSEDDIIQCYIPVESGKSVMKDMSVIVYPTNVNRQEYGHMEATVVSVDDYVASSLEIKQALGDETLYNAFIQQGPVIGIECRLRTDDTAASGYYWSSKKGKTLVLPSATVVSADIVVEKMHPIEYLIPFIKEKADDFVSPEEEEGSEN